MIKPYGAPTYASLSLDRTLGELPGNAAGAGSVTSCRTEGSDDCGQW
jgi:hypothetical protein